MSGHGFHVHGPHDHAIEHAAKDHGQGHGEPHESSGKIAVITAIIATVGAMFGYMGGATQANAGLLKNDAAIKKTEASNKWNYYQAKSSKQNLSELALELATDARKDFYTKEIARYKDEKKVIQKEAEALETEATAKDKESGVQMHQHHRWAQATTFLQIAIALAAIALLTKKKWFEWAMYGVAGLGLVVGGLALAHI
jgi:hypothetical protein